MLQAADSQWLQVGLSLLKWLGITSVLGGIGYLVTLHYLLPRLTIIEVRNPHPKHSFESRIVVQNIGKLPAYRIWANPRNIDVAIGGVHMENSSLARCGQPATRLDGGEKMEIPALPSVGTDPGIPLALCKYKLELEYDFKLLGYRRTLKRFWNIELRNFPDGFIWQYSAL
jgi:hypothetical protein